MLKLKEVPDGVAFYYAYGLYVKEKRTIHNCYEPLHGTMHNYDEEIDCDCLPSSQLSESTT